MWGIKEIMSKGRGSKVNLERESRAEDVWIGGGIGLGIEAAKLGMGGGVGL